MPKKKSTSRELMLNDLKRSGLTDKDSRTLKLSCPSKSEAKAAIGKAVKCYKIPYFDLQGKQTDFYRVRILEATGFGANQQKKFRRYSQPKDSGVKIYMPPFTKWSAIATDTSKPICITEGEKKAAKACKEGIPCIGLGGVWSFRSKKDGQSLLKDFYDFNWKEREVYLIFDSDLKHNINVQKALYTLADKLVELGAYIYIGFLPEGDDGEKVGLDDYLVTHKASDLANIATIDYELSRDLWKLNDEIAILKTPSSIFHFETKQMLSRDILVNLVYADRIFSKEQGDKLKDVNAAAEWLKWPQRRIHQSIVYEPGKDEICDNNINSWTGWGVTPKKGSIKIWHEFMDYFFAGDPEFRQWFEQWLAYPLQHPGHKLYTCVLLYGLTQGTGKSFIGSIIGRIYGDNYSEVTQEDIHSDFNHWVANKQFIMGEEITGSDRRRDADRIKTMITRNKLIVNLKYTPTYEIKDCVNYLFTSNHPDAFLLEASDRRVAVHEAPVKQWGIDKYFELDTFKNSDDGIGALFHYFLNEVDISDFNPLGEAPSSFAKTSMQELSIGDLDTFARDLATHPDEMLMLDDIPIERDLYTLEELRNMYDPDGMRKTTNIALSKALIRAGFIKLQATTTLSGTKRLWAVRNKEYWATASHSNRCDHYDQTVKQFKQKTAKYKA